MAKGQETKKDGRANNGIPGNKFWRNREKHGRPTLIETPEKMLDLAFEYFDWVDENPLWEMKAFGTGLILKVPKVRPMTIAGLCIHLGIHRRTWLMYREREAFADACAAIDEIIFQQKFEGAAAGLLNPAIIARDLGLADKKDVDATLTIEVVDSYGEDNDSE